MDKQKLWQQIQEELKISVSRTIYQTLFSNTFLISLENKVANIACPSSYIQNLIETRYYSLLKDILDRKTKEENSLVFTVKLMPKDEKKEEFGPLFDNKEIEEASFAAKSSHLGLKANYTFENFCVSQVNQLAYAAATAVAKNLGKAYNPLFLWGGVGVGKTHLMQAIGHEVLKYQPEIKIIYCMGEEFTNEIINAIRSKTTDLFKKKYRGAQLLLLDDVQFIAGKDTVQEEFFHTFNAILQTGGQVVLVSDRPPEEIAKLEERLRSRFEAGLIIDIPAPDFELRSAILLTKAKQKGINLPMDLAQMIASNIDSTRKLEGFLVRLQSEIQTKNIAITADLVRTLLGKGVEDQNRKKMLKPKEIIKLIADYYNLKISDICGQKRIKEYVLPRQILMYLLRTEAQLSLMSVAELLGNRDHTTVMHGVDKITRLLSENEDLSVQISGIKQKLYE
jgi:chromosomal replication initiator protein